MRSAAALLIAFVALAGTASAQSAGPYNPSSSGPSIGFRAFALVDANMMAATDSFDAVFGNREMTGFGGGAEIDLWKHLFVRFTASQAKRTGSRVFVDNGDVYDLGIPMTVTLTPIEGGGGWRFTSASRITPYIGASFISLGYQQVSDFAQAGENLNERYTGGAAFGGVDFRVGKGLFVGGEAQFRSITVPDVSGSVMHEFGETDLGGVSARIRIGFSTK